MSSPQAWPWSVPRLLLVEDDPELSALLIEVLSEDYRVDHCSSAENGMRLALRSVHDVMVIDRMLPGADGLEMIERLRRAHLRTPMLILTALGSLEDRVSGLDGGANDYLVKPFEVDELLARLRALVRGFRAQTRRRDVGAWTHRPEDRLVESPWGSLIQLTERENALLTLLGDNPERVCSRETILSEVFSPDDTPGTVDTYVHYLRMKTDREVVVTVRAQGYRWGSPQ